MSIFVCRVICEDKTFFIYRDNNDYWIETSRTANPVKPLSCYDSKEAAIDAIELRYKINAIMKESGKTALEAFMEAERRSKNYYSIDNSAVRANLPAAIMRGANTFESNAKGNAIYRVWLHLLVNDRLTAVPHMRYISMFSALDSLVELGWIAVDDTEKHITIYFPFAQGKQ